MPSHPHTASSSLILALCILVLLPACEPAPTPTSTTTPIPSETPTLNPSPTVELPTQTPYIITATTGVTVTTPSQQGVFFFSMTENGFSHLFAYSPQSLSLTRLTSDSWDDITPAVSPDGSSLAFSSRRNGYWDLYRLNLSSGEITRLTDTPDYEGAPTWSPDGANLAYESYVNGNLDIFYRSSSDPGQGSLPLTQDPAADTSPAWSPRGRQIAFISVRSGEPEVWIADLDHAGASIDVSNNSQMAESHPAWSPDGNKLVWAANDPISGLTGIYIWDARSPEASPLWAGSGDWPVWQDNNTIASRLLAPNQTFLSGYLLNGTINIPPFLLPGDINGLSFGVTNVLFPGAFLSIANVTLPAPIGQGANQQTAIPAGRVSLVTLNKVTAPFPQLSQLAFNSFQSLRTRLADQTGWDVLGNLENAFVPLTVPLDPGLGDDWLFTGRAFTVNPALIQAGWMVVGRENFGRQTYWRIYLHTTAQDGSQGMPLTQVPWDFLARATSSSAYENGGQLMKYIPDGYWLDLTTLASQFGWQRLPALTNWQSYYAGARFNELFYPQGLDWKNAMLQLYPPEVLVTPTIVIPPTLTPTRTPLWYSSPTPTRTPTARPTTTPKS